MTLPNGKRKYYRAKTKKEAEEKRTKDRIALGQGLAIDDGTTFEQMAKMWFELYKEGTLHKRSVETISNILKRYILPEIGQMPVQMIRPIHIQKLMHSVSSYSNSTQKKVLQYTKAVLRTAVDNRLIAVSPVTSDIKAAGAPPAEVVPLSDAQCCELLNCTKSTRAYPFLLLLRFTGLRKGEALGLMWSDIDFDANTITVNRSIVYPEDNKAGEINTELKSENAHRVVPMVQELRDELIRVKKSSNSLYVFPMSNGNFMSESSFRRMWDVAQRRVDFNIHPHMLRHTCATAWVKSGIDPKAIQYLLGHKTIDITMEKYAHYMEELRRAETAKRMQEAMPAFAAAL